MSVLPNEDGEQPESHGGAGGRPIQRAGRQGEKGVRHAEPVAPVCARGRRFSRLGRRQEVSGRLQRGNEEGNRLRKIHQEQPARSELAGDVCVDNAMNNAGTELPDGCPVGEKFTFEIPYIMQTAGWTHMAFCHNAPILTKEFAEFRKSVQSKRQYLVVWTQN